MKLIEQKITEISVKKQMEHTVMLLEFWLDILEWFWGLITRPYPGLQHFYQFQAFWLSLAHAWTKTGSWFVVDQHQKLSFWFNQLSTMLLSFYFRLNFLDFLIIWEGGGYSIKITLNVQTYKYFILCWEIHQAFVNLQYFAGRIIIL